MAQSFTALGKGNGFPFCLTEVDVPDDAVESDAPTLKETMNAYWNFKSATFGNETKEATFEPGNEPKDLICDETLNIGSDEVGTVEPNKGGKFSVSNNFPSIFSIGGNKYYRHGISMSFAAENLATGNFYNSSSIEVNYFSGYYVDSDSSPYNCVDLFFGEPPEQELIGRRASERIQNFSNVTISGIPFIKAVIKIFDGEVAASGGEDDIGAVPPCPTANYPAEPGTPTLKLHTY